jgi:NAD(P)-dependent dehydrogenase (short-subunit alcohol dehydrogenase family)
MDALTPHALITGASSGIGHAVALALAGRGYRITLLGRDPARLRRVRDEARDLGVEATEVALDLTDDGAVASLARGLAGDRLDALIHSAGVVRLGSVEELPVETLDEHYRVNLRAPYLLSRALLAPLRSSRGRLVFVNSGAGKHAYARWSAYAASKFGLRALADSLRQELAPDGVAVTTVYPGPTATPMQRSVREQQGQPYDPDAFVRPEDVATQVAALLALPAPSVVTELELRPL